MWLMMYMMKCKIWNVWCKLFIIWNEQWIKLKSIWIRIRIIRLWYDMWCVVNMIISKERILSWYIYVVYWIWKFVWDILALLILGSHKGKCQVIRIKWYSYTWYAIWKKLCQICHMNSSCNMNRCVLIM